MQRLVMSDCGCDKKQCQEQGKSKSNQKRSEKYKCHFIISHLKVGEINFKRSKVDTRERKLRG